MAPLKCPQNKSSETLLEEIHTLDLQGKIKKKKNCFRYVQTPTGKCG